MREIGRISQALFDKIRGRFDKVNLGDDRAKATTDPEEAKFINFNYTSKTGHSFGHVTLSLIDDNNLKIYFNKKLSKSLAPEDKTEWYAFLKDLRHFARRNMINFETRDISRDGLGINDIKQASHADATFDKDDVNVQEAKHFKTAYGWAGGAKPGGGTYKHPDQIKADRKAKAVKSKETKQKLPDKVVAEGWVKAGANSQERIRHDNNGVRVRTPDGEGTIWAEHKLPTFSQMVPFVHQVMVNLDSGETKSFRANLVKKIKTTAAPVSEASHFGKDYGVRYKVFAGREGRLVTKDAFFAIQEQLDRAVEKIQNLGNFYQIDGYSLPPAAVATEDVGMNESRMFGSSRSSYQNIGPAKIIVKHSNPVSDEVRGSRTRNIESVFIQTNEGERFKLPFKKLAGARAMATHVSNGGTVYDDLGQHITETVKEMSALSGFVRNGRNKTFEDAEAMGMLEASMERYVTLHKNLRGMSNPRGYNAYKECFSPEKQMLGEVDLASLKEKFIKKNFDERLTPALEYAYRAYQNKLLEADKPNQYVAEFEDWANEITNAKKIPQTPEEFNQLSELLTSTLHVGMDGDNATNALRELIGDEELFDTIYAVSQSQGEEADARPIIIGWLTNNAPDVLNHVAVPDEMKQGDSEEAETPAAPTKLGPRQPVPHGDQEEVDEGEWDGKIRPANQDLWNSIPGNEEDINGYNYDARGSYVGKGGKYDSDGRYNPQAPEEVTEMKTHDMNCPWNYGHDCTCGEKTDTHDIGCHYNMGHDCNCSLANKSNSHVDNLKKLAGLK